MIFGKIDYLNLLPFHIFLKRYPLKSYTKKSIEFKKGVPSKMCDSLKNRRVNGAIISSIESKKSSYKVLNFGIVAKKSVKSVLVRKNSLQKDDPASRSSNMLAKILDLRGEILIGDRALKEYIKNPNDFVDMAEIWHKKTNLPFVFGRFTYTSKGEIYKKIVKNFLKERVFIPNYILNFYSQSRKIEAKNIKWYLNFISYEISYKERKSLQIFYKKSRDFR